MLQRLEFHAMGCEMLAAVECDLLPARLAQVPGWFEEWEQVLSRFRYDSELTRLNQIHGRPVAVSETLWQVFQAALQAEQMSGGLVTASLLDAILAAGYDRPFDELPEQVSSAEKPVPARTKLLASFGSDDSARTISLPPGAGLDFGGIAKGWAAQQAMLRLREAGPSLVDAGGDIAISGPRAGGHPWKIGVANPFQPDQDLETLKVMGGGVATSGKDHRHWSRNGIPQHHIIDPHTGRPAQTDLLTVSVVAPDVLQAESAAKAVLILGAEAGLAWIEAQAEFAGLLLLDNGNQLFSHEMRRYM